MGQDQLLSDEMLLEKVRKLFDSGTLRNSVIDIYKDVHLVFKEVITTHDSIAIDMHNSLIEHNFLHVFQDAYLTGECQMPANLRLLEDWVEKFANKARGLELDQEQYMFLAAGIIFGITNMVREFQQVKVHGL